MHCMWCTLVTNYLLIFILVHLSHRHLYARSSIHSINMCFGKTKTLKSLKLAQTHNKDTELGYNIDDNCEYLEYEKLVNLRHTRNDLRILQINVRGIKLKIDDLDTLIMDLKCPDIVIISETWLKPGEEKLINFSGYNYEEEPGSNKKIEGVGFLIKRGIIYKTRHDINRETVSDLDANNSLDELHSTILNILNIHALEKEVLIRPKRINKPWVSKGLENSIRKTQKLYQQSLANPKDNTCYKDYVRVLKKSKRLAKINHYHNKCKEFKQNSKKLWQLI